MAPGQKQQSPISNNNNGYSSAKEQRMKNLDAQQPPDDFLFINIYPQESDINNPEKPFLRRNISEGSYDDVHHYLDVQFRLLREDFISPLRDAIKDLRKEPTICPCDEDDTSAGKTKLKVYTDVTFSRLTLVVDDLSLVAHLNTSQINADVADKLFLFNNLVCFSADDFKSIIFATITESDYKPLVEKGIIKVKLVNDSDYDVIVFNKKYSMAESEVFFDPYYQVLNAMQTMALERFPLCQSIIGQRKLPNIPKYVTTKVSYNVGKKRFKLIGNESDWPTAKELSLNDSQYSAYKSALTSDFSLIQGPPGTGKTYLGIKVAEVLIENLNSMVGVRSATGHAAPILVVCATNHALDQFLEGIIQLTPNVIRVGGQSKSEALQKYQLNANRHLYNRENKKGRQNGDKLRKNLMALQFSIGFLLTDINAIAAHRGIVALNSLVTITGTNQLARFNGGIMQESQFLRWLEDDQSCEAEFVGSPAPEECHVALIADFAVIKEALKKNMQQVDVLETELITKKNDKKALGICVETLAKLKTEHTELSRRLSFLTKHLLNEDDSVKEEDFLKQVAILAPGQVSVWQVPLDLRWQLYRNWVAVACTVLREHLHALIENFNSVSTRFKTCKMQQDLAVLQGAKVVGMTTSCAARLRPLLDSLRPRITIVEEAAEVLESHIVASLTKHCQHLILIGDHEQLRPKTSSHELSRDYRLDISLFERMLNNGVPYVTMNEQHRMRPEIAQLIVPAVYPCLTNSAAVHGREDVRGVGKNVFFIDHQKPEKLAGGSSRKNIHETDTVVALCRYLILQGYKAEKITIIAMYAAQVNDLERECHQYPELKDDLVISSVDGYQGEENDIVLLSLVRSNNEAQVGFLKTVNRVCVALSRARLGLYIIGNMENLTRDPRSIWNQIKGVLKQEDAIGPSLPLCCRVHDCQPVHVSSSADFNFAQVRVKGCPLTNCASVAKDKQNGHQNGQYVQQKTREFYNQALLNGNERESLANKTFNAINSSDLPSAQKKETVSNLKDENKQNLFVKSHVQLLVDSMTSLNLEKNKSNSTILNMPERGTPEKSPVKPTLHVSPLIQPSKLHHIFADDYKPEPSSSGLSLHSLSSQCSPNKTSSASSQSGSNQVSPKVFKMKNPSLADELFRIKQLPHTSFSSDYDSLADAVVRSKPSVTPVKPGNCTEPNFKEREIEFCKRLELIRAGIKSSQLSASNVEIKPVMYPKRIQKEKELSQNVHEKGTYSKSTPNLTEDSINAAHKLMKDIVYINKTKESDSNVAPIPNVKSTIYAPIPLARTAITVPVPAPRRHERQENVEKGSPPFMQNSFLTFPSERQDDATISFADIERNYETMQRKRAVDVKKSVVPGKSKETQVAREVEEINKYEQEYIANVERNLAYLRKRRADLQARKSKVEGNMANSQEMLTDSYNLATLRRKRAEDAAVQFNPSNGAAIYQTDITLECVQPPYLLQDAQKHDRPNTGAIPKTGGAIRYSYTQAVSGVNVDNGVVVTKLPVAETKVAREALLGEHRRNKVDTNSGSEKKKNCVVM